MFRVTYLGQQGWLIACGATHVLVDPLLTDEYSPGFSAEVFPARGFDFAAFPPIDAVVLSHEHADHLSAPSLAMVDRRVPVVLPARAARAMRDVVTGLGFRVVDAPADSRYVVGDLVIELLAGALHRDAELESEWTTLQVLIADRHGHGSFFTYVDSWPTEATLAAVRRAVGRVGIFCHANNTMNWGCLEGGHAAPWPRSTLDFAAEVIAAEATWWRDDRPPALTVVCGPGLAFVGADAWMNQILCADSGKVCDALRALDPARAFHAPRPGDTLALVDGSPVRKPPRARFVRPHTGSVLRVRTPPVAVIDDFAPACGRRTVAAAAWPALERELDQLARYLYRRSLFRALHADDAIATPRAKQRRIAFALVLRCDDDAAHVYEYQPESCRFARVTCRAPLDTYVVGLECWVADLAGVLAGEMLPQRLLGHLRTWSFFREPMSPLAALWGFFDFVHRPDAAAAFYGPRVAQLRDLPPAIAAGGHARALRRTRPR